MVRPPGVGGVLPEKLGMGVMQGEVKHLAILAFFARSI